MAERTILVLGSNDVMWSSLRTVLDGMQGFAIVDGDPRPEQPDRAPAPIQPDVVILGAEGDAPTPQLVNSIRTRFPASRLVVLGSQSTPAALGDLIERGVAAYLLWRDLDLVSLQGCLDVISSSDVVLASRQLVRDYPSALFIEETDDPEEPPIVLTRREYDILRWLAAGLTQAEIAATLEASLRTVKRDIASLHRKLDARTPFALGLKASALGLAPEPVQ